MLHFGRQRNDHSVKIQNLVSIICLKINIKCKHQSKTRQGKCDASSLYVNSNTTDIVFGDALVRRNFHITILKKGHKWKSIHHEW